MEKYAELCDEAVGTLPENEQEEACRDRDAAYTEFEKWTRRARVKVRQHTQETPPKVHGPGRSHLQRVPLPHFSGKSEDWPEFRRYFGELTKDEQFPPGIMMAQIREHLRTPEARALIAGNTEPTEAWKAQDKRYGDKELALVDVQHKLASLDTSRGEGYEKVETLLQGVNEARATLKAVGAEEELFNYV